MFNTIISDRLSTNVMTFKLLGFFYKCKKSNNIYWFYLDKTISFNEVDENNIRSWCQGKEHTILAFSCPISNKHSLVPYISYINFSLCMFNNLYINLWSSPHSGRKPRCYQLARRLRQKQLKQRPSLPIDISIILGAICTYIPVLIE